MDTSRVDTRPEIIAYARTRYQNRQSINPNQSMHLSPSVITCAHPIRTGRAVVGRTAAARAAVACRAACVAVGRAVIIVVVVNIIVRKSADPKTMRSIVLKSYPLSRVGAATRASIDASIAPSMDVGVERHAPSMGRSHETIDGMGWDRIDGVCVGGIRGWGCDWSMGVSIGESGENL
jgi:hypothetical protein